MRCVLKYLKYLLGCVLKYLKYLLRMTQSESPLVAVALPGPILSTSLSLGQIMAWPLCLRNRVCFCVINYLATGCFFIFYFFLFDGWMKKWKMSYFLQILTIKLTLLVFYKLFIFLFCFFFVFFFDFFLNFFLKVF